MVMTGEGSGVGDSHPGVFFLSTGRGNDPPADVSLSSKPLKKGKHRVWTHGPLPSPECLTNSSLGCVSSWVNYL